MNTNGCVRVQKPDARWGCGYRNIQVQISGLLARAPELRNLLFVGRGVPTVPSLQQWLEAAWRDGFDVDGAEQLVRFLFHVNDWT